MFDKYLIAEVKDSDQAVTGYKVRKSSRGILIWKDKVALLNVTKYKYHKVPGGGIEKNETKEEAFKREILEETGCKSSIRNYLGLTLEYRDEFKLVQVSYIFIAEVIGRPAKPTFEKGEIEEGFVLEWFPIEKAEKLIRSDKPRNYEGTFIRRRDLAIFEFYRKKIKK